MSQFSPMDIANLKPEQLRDWLDTARKDEVYALLRSLAAEYKRRKQAEIRANSN